jgi:hypothetical protein
MSGLPDGFHPWTYTQARDAPAVAAAAQRFEAHATNASAAGALTTWFRQHALDAGPSVYIRLIDGKVAAYVALQSAAVKLRRGQAQRLGHHDEDHVPACRVTHVARDHRFPGAGREIILYAASLARRVNAVQRTTVLILDPFDAATEDMWRREFNFWSTRERADNGCRRLYHPVEIGRRP